MKRLFSRLEVQIGLGVAILLGCLGVLVVVSLTAQSRGALIAGAEARQKTSMKLLASAFESTFGASAEIDAEGTVIAIRLDAIPDIPTHDLVDEVGRVSGETATIFAWSEQEKDFLRVSTNIMKPDGTRAVGTVLGRENPVFAAMTGGDVFLGSAIILGKPYLTKYVPVLDAANEAVGILYVGVERSEIDAALREMTFTTNLKVAAGLVFAMFVTAIGLRRLLRPLKELDDAIVHIRDGDLAVAVPHEGRADNVGAIARSTRALRDALAEAAAKDADAARNRAAQDRAIATLSGAMERLAAQDLTHRIGEDADFPAEYEGLRSDFDTVADRLQKALASIADVAGSVRAAAGELGGLSSDLHRRVERQAATLEETAAALEEITRAGKAIRQRVEDADGLARRSVEVSERSGAQLETAIEAMKRIETASGKIDSIVDLIEDIAFQTNLLALNAGVEAARAGEAGKGFAVVATEVRSLAHRASESVGEIRELTRENMLQVNEGSGLVQATGESIGEVLEQIRGLGALVSDITGEVQGQTNGLAEINTGMQDLDRATQENAALAGQSESASAEMRGQADSLFSTLSAFRLTERQTMSNRRAA